MSESLLYGNNGYIIDTDFLNSREFTNSLIKVLFENYLEEMKDYLAKERIIDIDSNGGLNDLLSFINNKTLISDLAIEVDGKVNKIILKEDTDDEDFDKLNAKIIFCDYEN